MAPTLDKAREFLVEQHDWSDGFIEDAAPQLHAYTLSITPEIRAETRREIADEVASIHWCGNQPVLTFGCPMCEYIEKQRGNK